MTETEERHVYETTKPRVSGPLGDSPPLETPLPKVKKPKKKGAGARRVSDEGREPDEPLRIVQPDAYYRRLARRSDRRDRGLIALFVVITVVFFGGLFVWMFLRGPFHHPTREHGSSPALDSLEPCGVTTIGPANRGAEASTP